MQNHTLVHRLKYYKPSSKPKLIMKTLNVVPSSEYHSLLGKIKTGLLPSNKKVSLKALGRDFCYSVFLRTNSLCMAQLKCVIHKCIHQASQDKTFHPESCSSLEASICFFSQIYVLCSQWKQEVMNLCCPMELLIHNSGYFLENLSFVSLRFQF